MRIGIVSFWFNRGQGTVGRHIRSIFDQLGHETFVLARPTKDSFVLSNHTAYEGVWKQPGVTFASHYLIPDREYVQWAKKHRLEVIFFDQNYQFNEIQKLRQMGIKTVGRFVWEAFRLRDAKPAHQAFDVIYSLTRCEQERYQTLGISSPFIQWGCHPEMTSLDISKRTDAIYFFYPGGFVSRRKPTEAVVQSFRQVDNPDIRLLVKSQNLERIQPIEELVAGDRRISIIADDLPTAAYYELMGSCQVCLAPSRWEGLGLHLYESLALGLPIITNDNPPMNEIVRHNLNGLLVKSYPQLKVKPPKSGIPGYEPDVDDLSRAIATLADPEAIAKQSSHAKMLSQGEFNWDNTVKQYASLLTDDWAQPFL